MNKMLALIAMAAVAACHDGTPGAVTHAEEPTPGDPAAYAPDNWPLQVGDRVSSATLSELRRSFQVPLPPPGESAAGRWSRPWRGHIALHVVDDRVYEALFEYDPTKLGDYGLVYRGHFPRRFREWKRKGESDLPSEFHGKVEYFTPIPLPPRAPEEHAPVVIWDPEFPPRWDEDGRLLRVDPDYVPTLPDPLAWPEYPGRAK